MNGDEEKRRPQIFSIDDERLRPSAPEPAADAPAVPPEEAANIAAITPLARPARAIGWAGILISALGGLVSLALTVWVTNFVAGLFANGGWLGYLALALALVAALAAFMIVSREIVGFFRLGRVAVLRLKADAALAAPDRKAALGVSAGIAALFADREELRWGARRLADHRGDVLSPREVLILTEREMLVPLDRRARAIIGLGVRRVSLLTAISPSAILDVTFVAIQVLTMLRRLATLYGGRPGFLGSLRLARLVLGHLALTGGVALGDDVLQQLIGHGLTARLSRKLGEGLVNGAFTGRIGIAAVELCRPLPFIEAQRPRLRDFLAELRPPRP
jgi:putative membrane protein